MTSNHTPARHPLVALGVLLTVLALAAPALATVPARPSARSAPGLGAVAIRQSPDAPRVFDSADPALLTQPDALYLFGSTNNRKVPVRRIDSYTTPLSQSQSAWAQNARDAMPTRPAWVDASEWEIWAPSVIEIGSQFVLYFSAARGGPTSDEHNDKCIGRAHAPTVMGPYTPEASPVYCGLPAEGAKAGLPPSNWWGRSALDPEVIRGADGQLYMLMALGRSHENIGVVRLDAAGNVIGGPNATPSILAWQAQPWHDGTNNATLGAGAFLENPSMIHDPATNTYLLFYSAGQWYTPNYVTGFGRCTTPMGPCTLDTRAPFLRNGNGRTGAGGLTAFRDGAGVARVAYATWQQGFENQVGSVGQYKRQTHWMTLALSGSNPATQSVSLAAANGSVAAPTCQGEFATIIGTGAADNIVGTAGRDVIVALGGNDTINGRGGNDLICAGTGSDTLRGGKGADHLYGEGGKDTILADGGKDFINGGPGNDFLKGGLGKDQVWGAGNFDKCWGEQMRCEVKHRTLHNGTVL
ncbi:MAG: family 43 glycosylhydrolase [Acidimicrobiia bacterium]|nr:family 43 glycosylhydrolase [Acidimicrobiia bacterium]